MTYKPFVYKIRDDQYHMFEWRYSVQESPKPNGFTVSVACSSDGWVPHEMSYQGMSRFLALYAFYFCLLLIISFNLFFVYSVCR
jgi:hypothetical protein